jgi:light-regulated signal transduction histidine kinase (bacteriophytochrome)
METVEEIDRRDEAAPSSSESICVQPGCYLLELSPDWIVLRASENIDKLLGASHVTLIDESLGKFVHSQALHDLRNLFSRLSGAVGIARAYSVRLTDEPELVDIAFQLSGGRVLLEAVPAPGCFGEHFGSVGGLTAGLSDFAGDALLEGAARRMRALTGYDRVTLRCGDERAESSRARFSAPADARDLPLLIADADARGIEVFPRERGETSVGEALMRAPSSDDRGKLREGGIRAMLRVPFTVGQLDGEFCCESRAPHQPSFELHAAAELFAQMFALRLQLNRAAKH